jgi:hypothetical protein
MKNGQWVPNDGRTESRGTGGLADRRTGKRPSFIILDFRRVGGKIKLRLLGELDRLRDPAESG